MMNINPKYKAFIESDKLNDALSAASFLANNFLENGRYNVPETWGPEGILYLAESSYALIRSFEISNNPFYLKAVESILNELKRIQKPSGGWALELGKSGIGFKIDNNLRKITAEIEDLPPTVGILKTIADYTRVSGKNTYLSMGKKAFNYLMDYYDEDYGSFKEKENNKLMALRSNPRSYHLFSLLGIFAWRSQEPLIIDRISPKILEFVKATFESYDNETMPLVYGLHAALLVQHTSDEYKKEVIKPRIDEHLVYNKRFQIPNLSGGYGHHDGLRGIVTDEAHLRSSAGIIIAMKFYDVYTNTRTYRDTKEYKDISKWIQNMKGDGFYYEYELLPSRKKIGYGSPGQYLPIWWILGGF